MPTCRQ